MRPSKKGAQRPSPAPEKTENMVRWVTPLYKEIKMPTKRSPNNILISPGDINISLYQILLLAILSCSPLEKLLACSHLSSS